MNTQTLAAATIAMLMGSAGLSIPATAQAQTPAVAEPPPSDGPRIGLHGLGLFGANWQTAADSFEGTGLSKSQVEFGAGVQVSDLWRRLFVQVTATRWSSNGERVFVDSSGEVFPLGIPLEVTAKYIDAGVGWKFDPQAGPTRYGVVPYVGAGAGVVQYSESSPFPQPGDDLESTTATYSVFGGVEVPILSWLGVTGDVRYRFVPSLLGEEGASGAFAEDNFGGVQVGVALRIGFGGTPVRRVPPPRTDSTPDTGRFITNPPARPDTAQGVIAVAAPAYLLPDRNRTPLRTLEPGTTVRIIEETAEWVRIEFNDPQYGPRVGYVERKFLRR